MPISVATGQAQRRRQLQSSLLAAPPEEKKDDGGGFLGTGIGPDIGPDIDLPGLGITTALRELGQGVMAIPGALYSTLPGGPKSQLPQFSRALGSSLLGTASTALKPFGIPGTGINLGDLVVEPLGEKITGIKPQDFLEKARDRGVIPALVEDVGNVALGAGAALKVARMGSGAAVAGRTALAAGDVAAAAAAAERFSTLQKLAHPYQTVARGFTDVTRAARTARFVDDAEALPEPPTKVSEPAPERVPEPVDVPESELSPLEQAVQEAVAAIDARTPSDARALNAELLRAFPDEETVTLYKGFNLQNADSPWWTTNRARAAGYGDVQEVEVPMSVAEEARAAAEDAFARGEGQPTTTDFYLDVGDEGMVRWVDAARHLDAEEIIAQPALFEETGKTPKPNRPRTRGDAEKQEQYRQAEREAADALVDEEHAGLADIAARLEDSPEWATRLIRRLPEGAVRTLAAADRPVQAARARRVARLMQREVEQIQQQAEIGPAVQASVRAAEELMKKVKLDRFDASQLVGAEIRKRATGTVLWEQLLRDGGNTALADKMRHLATRGMPGIPESVWKKFTPEVRAAIETQIEEAVTLWKADAAKRLEGLLASPGRGALGIEQAVLDDLAPMMTKDQVRRYTKTLMQLRRAEKAREKAARLAEEAGEVQQSLLKADEAVIRVRRLLTRSGRYERLAKNLEGRAARMTDTLAEELGSPRASLVPPRWQPMMQAIEDLRREADLDPTGVMADAIAEIPATFEKVLEYAEVRGFDPFHLPEMTWERAQDVLFGHVRLGAPGREVQRVTAATRRKRAGRLAKEGLVDTSIEALAAGFVDVGREIYSNRMVDFIESHWVREIPSNTRIPEGWQPWDPERTFVLTGQRVSGGMMQRITGQQTSIRVVPREVVDSIKTMNKSYDHWLFHTVTRVSNPWRTAVLTLSPKWYENAVFGNLLLATAEGVRLRDWAKAWRKQGGFRQFVGKGDPGDLPIFQRSLAEATLDEGVGRSVVHRSIRDAIHAEGIRSGLHETSVRLRRTQDFIDSIARSAVYEKTLRTTGSRSRALMRASEALVDYNNLGPLERSLVRSVVPFYAWMKGVFKLLSRFPADHPMATPVLMQLGRLREELLEEKFGGEVPDAYLGVVPEFGNRNLRSWNPYLDAFQLTTPEGIANAANPFVEVIVRDALHAPEGFPTRYEIGATGRPVPDVDVAAELFETFRSVPAARPLETAVTGEDVYGQDIGLLEQLARFGGAPRAYTDEEIAAIMERLAETREITEGGGTTLTVPRR